MAQGRVAVTGDFPLRPSRCAQFTNQLEDCAAESYRQFTYSAWDWGQPAIVREQLLLLGYTEQDLTFT